MQNSALVLLFLIFANFVVDTFQLIRIWTLDFFIIILFKNGKPTANLGCMLGLVITDHSIAVLLALAINALHRCLCTDGRTLFVMITLADGSNTVIWIRFTEFIC